MRYWYPLSSEHGEVSILIHISDALNAILKEYSHKILILMHFKYINVA